MFLTIYHENKQFGVEVVLIVRFQKEKLKFDSILRFVIHTIKL